MADQSHRLMTAGTGGRRCGRRGLSEERLPIQQSEDTLPSGFGGGTEPAEIANALKAFGQHMLKEAAEKLRSGQGESAPLLILTVFVFKGDLPVVGFDDPLGTQGGVADVGRQIFDGGFTRTGRLHIHDPLLPPDKTWDRVGVRRWLEGSFESVAETGGQDDLRQEEVG